MVFHILFAHPSVQKPPYPLSAPQSTPQTNDTTSPASPPSLLPLSLFITILESFPQNLGFGERIAIEVPHYVSPEKKSSPESIGGVMTTPRTENNGQQDDASSTGYSYQNTRHLLSILLFPDPVDPYTHHLYHPIHSRASSLDNSSSSVHHKRVPYCSMKFHCAYVDGATSARRGAKTDSSSNDQGYFTLDISQTSSRFLQNLTDAVHLSQILAKRYGLTLFYNENNEWKKLSQSWLNEKFWNQLNTVHKMDWHRKRLVFVEKQLSPLEWALKAQIDLVSEFFRFKIDVGGIVEDVTHIIPTDRELLLWLRKHLRPCFTTRELVVDYGTMSNGKHIPNYEGFQMDTAPEDDVEGIPQVLPPQEDEGVPAKGSITLTDYKFHLKHRRSLITRTQVEYKARHRQLQLTPYHAAQLGKLNRYVEWNVLATSTLLAVKSFLRRTHAEYVRVKFNEINMSEGLMQNLEKQLSGTGFEFYLWWKRVQEENSL